MLLRQRGGQGRGDRAAAGVRQAVSTVALCRTCREYRPSYSCDLPVRLPRRHRLGERGDRVQPGRRRRRRPGRTPGRSRPSGRRRPRRSWPTRSPSTRSACPSAAQHQRHRPGGGQHPAVRLLVQVRGEQAVLRARGEVEAHPHPPGQPLDHPQQHRRRVHPQLVAAGAQLGGERVGDRDAPLRGVVDGAQHQRVRPVRALHPARGPPARSASARRPGRGAGRRPTGRRTGPGTTSRPSRPGRPGHRSGSRRGIRSRRSAAGAPAPGTPTRGDQAVPVRPSAARPRPAASAASASSLVRCTAWSACSGGP